MSKHTPGPWVLEKAVGTDDMDCGWSVLPVIVDYNYRGEICHLYDSEHIHGITNDERDSNARLIAAAPDLLEACMAYIADREESGCTADSAAVKAMRAAIAKATGEQP
jgi:hypothetical protein